MPGATSRADNARVWALASLIASAIVAYFLSQALPVEAHADDWPGPGVGAALDLDLAVVAGCAGLLLAAWSWRPRIDDRLPKLALGVSLLLYAGICLCFLDVGLAPICGGEVVALAGAPPPRTSVLVELLTTTCGRIVLAEALVPIVIFAAAMLWRARDNAAPAAVAPKNP